tara:strand:+ start:3697 stop:4602 length:906 start_codon:yes stop_codon:yes gene_type:complete
MGRGRVRRGSRGRTAQGKIRSFAALAVSGQSNIIADHGADKLNIAAGSNITLTTNARTDTLTIASAAGGGSNVFKTISVSGQDDVVADSATDSLTLTAGANVVITTNASSDAITITGNISYVNNNYLLIGYDNSGTASTSDHGVIFKRGGANNQALVWDESDDEFAFIETTSDQSTSGAVNITAYAPIKASTYMTPSSIRLKENIVEIDNAINKLKKLRGVYFDWKESGKRDMGFIAEEIGKVIPEVVSYEDEENASGLDYSRLTSLLVESIKQQQITIEKQEKHINFLYKFLKLNRSTKT